MSMFQKAVKEKEKARIGLFGPSGSGKTWTALALATAMGKRVGLIDTEYRSSRKYADKFEFSVLDLTDFDPIKLIDLLEAARDEVDVLVIDSLSHFWSGKGGFLEQVDRITSRSSSKNAFSTGWREMSPVHNRLIDMLLGTSVYCHLICTARSKTEFVIEKDERTGRSVPRKIGMAPVLRDGMEYEFDIVGDLDLSHNLIISKTRCEALDGQVIHHPGEAMAKTIVAWCEDGVEREPATTSEPQPSDGFAQLNALLANHKIDKGAVCQAYSVSRLKDLSPEHIAHAVAGIMKKYGKKTEAPNI